ncbi:hypothetical protein MACJ_000627 [Theileria orientalis]|uniref:B30.2/SPRY domain-containing protein n=1 Tax=Theileria orientalis TaxID=68886 RepID=A0A976M6P8_THEOR|nr:hypothetical protein MACJ_000627 [Theileria orientalis]
MPESLSEKLYGCVKIPSCLNSRIRQHYITILKDLLTVEYTGKSRYCDSGSVQSDTCAPTNCPLYYYEVEILKCDNQPKIVVGFSYNNFHLNRHPGSEPNSLGYKSEDGYCMNGTSKSDNYGPSYGKGDVIGCGINYLKQNYFFTKNGSFLGNAGSLFHIDNYPTVGLNSYGESVKFNFNGPFKFNIEEYFRKILSTEREEINATPVSKDITNGIVKYYLLHRGYSRTLKAFKNEANKGEMNVDYLNGEKKENFIDKLYISNEVINKMESTLDKRSEIIDNILEGNINHALKALSDEFPHIQKNSMAYTMLVTQNFIEMLRSGSDIKKSLRWLQEYSRNLMPNGPEELENFFENDKVKQVFQESCGLLAYQDLEASPLKDNLLNKRRMETAIVVNDTILSKYSPSILMDT